MNVAHSAETNRSPPEGCVVRAVAAALAANPTLEAVTIHRDQDEIEVATLGAAPDDALIERVSSVVRQAQGPGSQCGLLTGQGTCQTCPLPFPPELQSNFLTLRQTPAHTTIARVTCPTAPRFWRWRKIRLPRVAQRQVEFSVEETHDLNEWKWQLLAAGLCGVAALVAHFVAAGPARLALHLLAYAAGCWFTVAEVWERLRRAEIDVHFLMLAVAAGSAAIGNWSEGATLLFLFALSGGLEHYAMARTRREIQSLFRSAPKTATLLEAAGHEREVLVAELRPGMRLLVKPGAQFPVDVEIAKGTTAADESNLTGEATPVEKTVGDPALAGTMNLWGAVEVVVRRPVAESALQQIIRLIQEAQHQKAPSQRFTDRFSAAYTYAVLGLTLVMFFVWWLGFRLPPFTDAVGTRSAFYHAMTLLVVASPCALVLSIPSAVLAAIAWGARHGILFRGGAAVEKLAEVRVVALDKTGTLTTGELRVERVESFPPGHETELARLAFSLERLSNHPLARAITRYGKQQNLEPLELQDFESVTGQGLRARNDGQVCQLGRREFIASAARTGLTDAEALEPGCSEVWVTNGVATGRVRLRDDIRPQSRPSLEAMQKLGLRTVLLTGDRRATAEHLSRELPLDEIRAELKPEQKVAAIAEFTARGQKVAMVGDGVNDAPSLAAAHVGVAMGARGSDAALEQADVVLLHDRIENFLAAFRLSQRARRVIRQNIAISLGTVAVLVSFALAGAIPLTVGVVGHEGSTVIVVMNSLRLLLSGPRRKETIPTRS